VAAAAARASTASCPARSLTGTGSQSRHTLGVVAFCTSTHCGYINYKVYVTLRSVEGRSIAETRSTSEVHESIAQGSYLEADRVHVDMCRNA
jgi:hypothetical protein